MTETKYTEIFRLKEMLEQAEIPFVYTDRSFPFTTPLCDGTTKFAHYHIEYPEGMPTDKRVCSVIQGYGSYGGQANLLEIMGLLTPKEEQENSVCGFLTAEEVFERIKHHYETEYNK
jgi:hypothetical protein